MIWKMSKRREKGVRTVSPTTMLAFFNHFSGCVLFPIIAWDGSNRFPACSDLRTAGMFILILTVQARW